MEKFIIENGVLIKYTGKETNVTIPDSVTSIGNYAFCDCTSLTSVTIPNGVTSIGGGAFYHCCSLKSIVISNNVTSIGYNAFGGCSSLTSVTIGESLTSIDSYAFYNCSNLQYNEYDNGYYLGNETNPYLVLIEAKQTNISSCIINENCKIIYGYAFENCSSLTSVTIPNSVTSIEYSAFAGCSNLQYNEYNNGYYLGNETNPYLVLIKAKQTNISSCIINENCKIIYGYAFEKCSSLTSVTIGNSVTSIGGGAFYNCSGLTSPKANYKAFEITKNGELQCRNKTYHEGKTSFVKDELLLCENGIHYCTNLFEIFNYYYGEIDKNIAIYECDVKGDIIEDTESSKCCCRCLNPAKRLYLHDIIRILNAQC